MSLAITLQIEFSALPRFMHPDLPRRALAAERDELLGYTVLIKHVERGRMKRRRAQVALHGRLGFENRARNTEAIESQCERESDRSCPDDEYAPALAVHASHATSGVAVRLENGCQNSHA